LDREPTFICSLPKLPLVLIGDVGGNLTSFSFHLTLTTLEEQYDGEVLTEEPELESKREECIAAEVNLLAKLNLHSESLLQCWPEENAGGQALVLSRDGRLFLLNTGQDHFLTALDSANLGEEVLDGSFRSNTAVFLIGGDAQHSDDADRRLYSKLCGQTVHIFHAYKDNLSSNRVLRLKDLCCGLALDPSERHFYTFLARKKAIGKFDAGETVRQKRV